MSSLAVEGGWLFHGAHAFSYDLGYIFGHLLGYALTLVHELLQDLSSLQHVLTAMHQLHRQTIILIELLVLEWGRGSNKVTQAKNTDCQTPIV